jgi:phosphatidylglycerophosphate synthase
VADQLYAPERRPLASRELGVWKRLAAWLAGRGVSPNSISTGGMIAGVAAGAAFALARMDDWRNVGFLAAAALIQLRLLANMLDGMVAIQSKKASPVGELFNEIPDRVSDAAILIGAGYAPGSTPVFGYLAACVALFVAYIRAAGKVAGAHQEFCGPMAKPQRMFVLTVAALFCGLTPAAWQPALPDWPALGVTGAALLLVVVGGLVTAVRRLVRIACALRRPPS